MANIKLHKWYGVWQVDLRSPASGRGGGERSGLGTVRRKMQTSTQMKEAFSKVKTKTKLLRPILSVAFAVVFLFTQVSSVLADDDHPNKVMSDKEKAITFLLDLGWTMDHIGRMEESDLLVYKDAISGERSSKFYRLTSQKNIVEEYDAQKRRVAKKLVPIEGTQKLEQVASEAEFYGEIARFRNSHASLSGQDLEDLYPGKSVVRKGLNLTPMSYGDGWDYGEDGDGWIRLDLDLVYIGTYGGYPKYSINNLFTWYEDSFGYSEDIVSAATSTTLITAADTPNFHYYWEERLLSYPYTVTYHDSAASTATSTGPDGIGKSFNLPGHTYPYVSYIENRWGYLEYKATVTPPNEPTTIAARADYAHQVMSVSFSFEVTWGSPSIAVTPSYVHDLMDDNPYVTLNVSP